LINIKSSIQNYHVQFLNRINLGKKNNYYFLVDSYFKNQNYNFLNNKKTIYIRANENSKSYNQISIILKKLLIMKVNKSSVLVCVGGGITQDITSFIANIIFRGINWIFIPTTLLSQSDSCIGSKIAINFLPIKNVLGGYWPPKKVIINTNFLKTLSYKDILSGLGEMSHYFYLSNKNDFLFFKEKISNNNLRNNPTFKPLIIKSLNIKKKFIEKDEYEKNIRIFLNYGHTFGHAIESISNFKIPHGIAVSMGMHIANFISFKLSYINLKELEEFQQPLEKIFFNYFNFSFSSKKIINLIQKDKKTINNKIRIIILKKIGKPIIKEFSDKSILLNYLEKYNSYKKNVINSK